MATSLLITRLSRLLSSNTTIIGCVSSSSKGHVNIQAHQLCSLTWIYQQDWPSKLPLHQSVRYGHKMSKSLEVRKNNPPKIETFEYSGDLRTLPGISEDEPLYPFLDLEKQIGQDEILKKLSSISFAKKDDKTSHQKELVLDRIIELFGPNSEMEQEIAVMTLQIRRNIPVCLKHRKNKKNVARLKKIIKQRHQLLSSLRELDHERFEWLLRELKIQYVIPKDNVKEPEPKEADRIIKHNEALSVQREKLEALKAQFEEEKIAFYTHKAKVLAEISQDLEKFGLEQDFLEQSLHREQEVKGEEEKRVYTWEDRVKMGMTDVKHLFPPKPMDPRLVKKYEKMNKKNKKIARS